MNVYLKTMMMSAAIAGFCVPAIAQASVGGVTGEARLHPGTQSGQPASRSMMRSRPMHRSNAPAIVRTEQALKSVPQAPTEERSFSFEPSQKSATGGCDHNGITTHPRRFSYEPSVSGSYSAPRMRGKSSQKPLHLLQKTDPDKYRSH